MYSTAERQTYLRKTIEKIESINLVEGIIQIGSGVDGYNDEYSDIDLMVATTKIEDASATKERIHHSMSEYKPIYIKEKQFSKDIYLLIVLLENKLEFNISIVPREFLSVKSPLWKVIVDKTGVVSEKMNRENDNFLSKTVKYDIDIDIPFEFTYSAMSFAKELKRNNLIYALRLLETMRTYTLITQAMNENKKLHQFKAYDTLDPSFVKEFLLTYPTEISAKNLLTSASKLKELFVNTLKQYSTFTLDKALLRLLENSLAQENEGSLN
ncbi:aminoglycoside 6-adenylyltransferase [Ferdinandcohnia sp. Marseille-Q9671]